MPPVIERRGSQHGAAAPGGDESAQRRAKAEDVHRVATVVTVAAERSPHDHPGRAKSAQHRAKLDKQVGGVQKLSRPMVSCQEMSQ